MIHLNCAVVTVGLNMSRKSRKTHTSNKAIYIRYVTLWTSYSKSTYQLQKGIFSYLIFSLVLLSFSFSSGLFPPSGSSLLYPAPALRSAIFVPSPIFHSSLTSEMNNQQTMMMMINLCSTFHFLLINTFDEKANRSDIL